MICVPNTAWGREHCGGEGSFLSWMRFAFNSGVKIGAAIANLWVMTESLSPEILTLTAPGAGREALLYLPSANYILAYHPAVDTLGKI